MLPVTSAASIISSPGPNAEPSRKKPSCKLGGLLNVAPDKAADSILLVCT
jgi:hypothetical protein